MHFRSRSVAALALLLSLAGCSVTMTTFLVPAQVWAGQVFEILLAGSGDWSSGSAGAVIQLPNGFTIEGADGYLGTDPSTGHVNHAIPNGGTRDAPALLATIAAEPGHYLASFHHRDISLMSASPMALRVYVRAPQGVAGTFTLKAVGAGSDASGVFQVTSPAGATSFANVVAAPHVQTSTVVGDPVAPFAVETAGLFATGATGLPVCDVAFGDIDGDGDDDLAIPAQLGNGLGPSIWRAQPGAPWTQQAFFPGPPGSQARWGLRFGDFDGDGHLDCVDSGGFVRFGDGGNTWTNGPALPQVTVDPQTIGIGDVDGDGHADIALATWSGDVVRVFRSAGNRTFASWSNNLPNIAPTSTYSRLRTRVLLADVTRDGRCDLLVSAWPIPANYVGVRVWAGNGNGGWTPLGGLPPCNGCDVGDFDGDGQPDLVVSTPGGAAVLRYSNGAFQQTLLALPAGAPMPASSLLLVDYDRDGWQDLVLGDQMGNSPATPSPQSARVVLVRNLAGAGLGPAIDLIPTVPGRYMGYGCYGLAVGDIDGDTWPDLAAILTGEQLRVWRNVGSGSAPFGSACSAPGFALPAMTTVGQVQRGSTNFALLLQNAMPNGACIVWAGFSRRYEAGLPILPYSLAPHGAPGCSVFASNQAIVFLSADASGQATWPVAIPNAPALQLATVFAQGAVLAPGANALGALFANAVAARIR